MPESPSVVVAGHLCLDIIPQIYPLPRGQLDQLLQPGHMTMVGPATISTGGPVSNTGLVLHLLGIPTRLVAKVGADALGEMVRAVLRAHAPGLDAGIVSDPSVSTSYTIILNPPGVDRMFLHCPAANDAFSSDDVDYGWVGRARLFHFGYPPIMRRMYENDGDNLVELFRRAKASGATTSLDLTFPDPNSPGGQADWRRIFRRVLPFVDIVAPSIEELLFMLHRPLYERLSASPGGLLASLDVGLLSSLSAELIEMGARVVMIKTGERGAYLRTAGLKRLAEMGRAAPADANAWADRELWVPCFAVEVVGTTGAGDATLAGFLAAWLRGFGPEQAMTMAVAVGACNVEAADALGGIRPWEEVLARIAAGWGRHIPWPLAAPHWAWDEAFCLWQSVKEASTPLSPRPLPS